ncbi:hypothetical protein Tco_1451441 [Tanacetum coccineum]
MPSFPPPEPTVSYFDDLDFFEDFENEFPAIVYNNTPTYKSDLLTEPILSPQHIDEFDLKDETSFSEYDEEEQNVLYFNDLFPFNIIHLDDLKSEKDNDDNEVDIIQSLGDMALPPHFMAEGLSAMMLMEHRDAQGVSLFTSRAWRFGEAVTDLDTVVALQFQLGGARRRLSWRQFILALGLHTAEELETVGFNFLGSTPSYTSIRDPILRLCHRLIACSIAGRSQAPEYLRFFATGMKSGALISGGQFMA